MTNVVTTISTFKMATKTNTHMSVDYSIKNKLLSALYAQKQTGEYCDVKFCLGDSIFSVHSCVLASFSPFLQQRSTFKSVDIEHEHQDCVKKKINNIPFNKDMFGMWSLKNPLHLSLSELGNVKDNVQCSECASKVIDFMYIGKIYLKKEHLEHIQQLGELLQISEINVICDRFIKKYEKNELAEIKQPPKKKLKINIDLRVPLHSKNELSIKNDKTFQHNGINEYSSPCDIDDISKFLLPLSQVSVDNNTTLPVETKLKENNFDSNNQIVLQNQLEQSTIVSSSGPYACAKCPLEFADKCLLQQHEMAHIGRFYTCRSCKFTTQNASKLYNHLEKANHNESVCSFCLFELETPEKLKEHIKLHSHSKPFFCCICDARFPTRASLSSHTPTHSTETPFTCATCEKSFKWKQALQSHMVVHTTKKTLLCELCGFSTAHKSSLRSHEQKHTGLLFKCPNPGCAFETSHKYNLNYHLLTHIKQKSYQCEICGCAFSQAKNLRRHAEEKHNDSVFKDDCTECEFKTCRKDKLIRHFIKKHPEGDLDALNKKRKERIEEFKKKAATMSKIAVKPNEITALPTATSTQRCDSVLATNPDARQTQCDDDLNNLSLGPTEETLFLITNSTSQLSNCTSLVNQREEAVTNSLNNLHVGIPDGTSLMTSDGQHFIISSYSSAGIQNIQTIILPRGEQDLTLPSVDTMSVLDPLHCDSGVLTVMSMPGVDGTSLNSADGNIPLSLDVIGDLKSGELFQIPLDSMDIPLNHINEDKDSFEIAKISQSIAHSQDQKQADDSEERAVPLPSISEFQAAEYSSLLDTFERTQSQLLDSDKQDDSLKLDIVEKTKSVLDKVDIQEQRHSSLAFESICDDNLISELTSIVDENNSMIDPQLGCSADDSNAGDTRISANSVLHLDVNSLDCSVDSHQQLNLNEYSNFESNSSFFHCFENFLDFDVEEFERKDT